MISFFQNLVTVGLVDALWSEIWKFGTGTGLIILCLALAWFSPVAKQFFLGVAMAIFLALVVYGYGIKQEKSVCAVQKIQFLKQLHKDFIFTARPKPRYRTTWPF
jgi:hypothetical protein